MQIIPVLDLLNGVVVRGVAGRRETYRPVESQIVSSPEPLAVARAFRDQFGLDQIYVADLDAILRRQPNFDVYRQLTDNGFSLLIDAAIESLAAAQSVLDAGARAVIAGLESTPGPGLLRELVQGCGAPNILFSLDLKGGQPILHGSGWAGLTPLDIAGSAVAQGIERLIVLDLAQVGMGAGLSTLGLCAEIRSRHPQVELITGGGVRNVEDLQLLAHSHIDGVLVASALHNGSIRGRAQ